MAAYTMIDYRCLGCGHVTRAAAMPNRCDYCGDSTADNSAEFLPAIEDIARGLAEPIPFPAFEAVDESVPVSESVPAGDEDAVTVPAADESA